MSTREPVFASVEEDREYLAKVKGAHYLKIGHRKLGRLLLGRNAEEIARGREAER